MTQINSMSKYSPNHEDQLRAIPGARYAVLGSRWNAPIVDALVEAAVQLLRKRGVTEDCLDVIRVPGAWELPVLAAKLAAQGRHAAIIALGCVVLGDTRHYEQVADGCAQGLMRVLNGVLAVEREADAKARAGGSHGNKGEEAALAALEMTRLWSEL